MFRNYKYDKNDGFLKNTFDLGLERFLFHESFDFWNDPSFSVQNLFEEHYFSA